MKATLEFDLNDPDDVISHKRCVKSLDMAIALFEILHNTRKNMHAHIERGTKDPYDLIEAVMDKIWDDARENGINIDELIN